MCEITATSWLRPTAAEHFVEGDGGIEAGETLLRKLIFRLKKGALSVERFGEFVGTFPVTQFRQAQRTFGLVADLALRVFLLGRLDNVAQGVFHFLERGEHVPLVTGNEFALTRASGGNLIAQTAAIKNGLRETAGNRQALRCIRK